MMQRDVVFIVDKSIDCDTRVAEKPLSNKSIRGSSKMIRYIINYLSPCVVETIIIIIETQWMLPIDKTSLSI